VWFHQSLLGEVLLEFVMDGRPETRQVGQVSSVSFFEPEAESTAARRTLAAVESVASAIVARWRAIILLFILILSIWLALQAFLLVRSAFSYVVDNLPKLSDLRKKLPSNPVSPNQIPPNQIPPKSSVATSPRPITNCWRNRSLGSDCFKPGTAGQKSPPPRIREPYGRPNVQCQISTMDCPW